MIRKYTLSCTYMWHILYTCDISFRYWYSQSRTSRETVYTVVKKRVLNLDTILLPSSCVNLPISPVFFRISLLRYRKVNWYLKLDVNHSPQRWKAPSGLVLHRQGNRELIVTFSSLPLPSWKSLVKLLIISRLCYFLSIFVTLESSLTPFSFASHFLLLRLFDWPHSLPH